MNINDLLILTEKIKELIYNLKIKENDTRKAYFENLYSIINEFYKGQLFLQISKEIGLGNIEITKESSHLALHIKTIQQFTTHDILSQAYQNELNRKLFLDSFTNFETSINLCFDELVQEEEKNNIIKDLNRKILKICSNLDSNKFTELESELYKNTFIPLSRKFRYLANRIPNCFSNDKYKNDIKFLEFCSKLRNSFSHSLGLYFGKDFNYNFEGIDFIFINKEFLVMEGNNSNIILQINEKITDIFYRLLNCLIDINYIKYPDDGF